MANKLIRPLNDEYAEYLRDESRTTGSAETISFPKSEKEVISILKSLSSKRVPITVQGARTGLAAAAVPGGGHVMNMSRMDAVTGMRCNEEGQFFVRLQPGTILSQLRKQIESKRFDTSLWSEESKQAYALFCKASEQFFPPDPTEASASLGGMVACNASGARSYLYGSTRKHISALRIALLNGDTLALRRGEVFAKGRELELLTEQGHLIKVALPTYQMPKTKNASGYYIEDNMDAIDLFIGSDGTLGVITEIEAMLSPLPQIIWGVSCFFRREADSVEFVIALRDKLDQIASIEFFDGDALAVLRHQRTRNTAFAGLPAVDPVMNAAIYVELHCDTEEDAFQRLRKIGSLMNLAGGNEYDTWVARNPADRDRLLFFRHAVPESVNMLIDQRKKLDPVITKLGTDMSVPNQYLRQIIAMYHNMLAERGLQSAIWGHIGDNHLHVNILPNNAQDYQKGKELYREWAVEATRLGGAVSAEHGVGKLKANFLAVMYGEDHLAEMAALKAAFDPKGLLGSGNLFAPQKGVED